MHGTSTHVPGRGTRARRSAAFAALTGKTMPHEETDAEEGRGLPPLPRRKRTRKEEGATSREPANTQAASRILLHPESADRKTMPREENGAEERSGLKEDKGRGGRVGGKGARRENGGEE